MKLFYRKYGSGPPLIILHGLYGSSDNWVSIATKLSGDFTVYLPDQRNHGQSPFNDLHDYESMRDDLFELANDLKLRKFFLAGHSMGGKTAISFASKWPEMINGLLIADISPFKNGNSPDTEYDGHHAILTAILSVNLSEISSRGEIESVLAERIPSKKVRGFIMKNLQRISVNSFSWKINALALINNLEKILGGIDRNDIFLQQVTGFPVIFLRGEKSDYLPIDDFRDIKNIFPAAEFITVPGAGHWIHSDSPEEVIMSIKKLLSEG